MKSFSQLLSEYIHRIGVSDAELARRLGVSRQTIFRWREGHIQRPRYSEDVLDLAIKLRLSSVERDELLIAAGFPPVGTSVGVGERVAGTRDKGVYHRLRFVLRRSWGWFLLLLAVLGIGLLTVPDHQPAPAAEGEILILVSEFSRAGGELGFNVAGRLEQGIQAALEELAFDSVRVEVYPEFIHADEVALNLLEELNAALIVWGEYDSGRVVAYVVSRDLSGEPLPLEKYWVLDRTETLPATINLDLPREVNWLAVFAIGRALQVQGSYELAQRAYQSGLQYAEDNPAREAQLYFYMGYAEALKSAVDYDRVIAYYSEVLSRTPEYAPALNNRAVTYMNRESVGDLKRAEEDLLRGIEIAPDHAKLYLNLGLVRIWQDKDSLAQGIEEIKRAQAIDPDSASIQNALCWNISLSGDPNEALAHCERAVALNPAGNHYDSLGLTLALLGRDEQAIQAFRKGLELMEQFDPSRFHSLSPGRLAWIQALSTGENPFDQATLEGLLHE